MRVEEIAPAIARLEMVTAAAQDDDDLEEIQAILGTFDDVPAQRELVWRLTVDTAEKIPHGGALIMRDRSDFLALGLLQGVDALGPARFREVAARLDERALSDLATSLVVYWHEACLQAAERALDALEVPEYAPEER